MELFVDLAEFTCFYQFLHDVLKELFSRLKKKQFYEHIMQKLVETGKYTEINKQFHVKFWPNWRKYRTLSYSFSRKIHHLLSNLWDEKTIYSCCSWHYWMRECATYNTNLKRTQPSRKVKLFYLGCLLHQDRDFHGNVLCTVVHVTIRVGT